MKEKIIVFFVGLFLGALISTGSMYAYSVVNSNNDRGMQEGQQQDFQGGMNQNGQTPPDMPNGNNTFSN